MRTAFKRSSNSPAKIGPGNQRAHVERDDFFVFQAFRYIAADDPLCEAFDDCGFADTGLADQDGIVLGAPRENLNDTADLFIASNNRIEFALRGELGQVAPVSFESFVRRLRDFEW